jgi:hypothetical protein
MENSNTYIPTSTNKELTNEVKKLSTPTPSIQKIEISLDTDLVNKLKTKADTANKTPSEVVAEILRAQLK